MGGVEPRGAFGIARDHPRAVDLAVCLAVFLISVFAQPPAPALGDLRLPELTTPGVVLIAVQCLALWWRRTRPVPVWLIVLGATVLAGALTRNASHHLFALVIAAYTLASQTTRRWSLIGGVVTIGTVVPLTAPSVGSQLNDPVSYAVAAWCGLAVALGDAVRSNRETVAAVVERARRAEESREQEARRQVAEERLRISRELHDVVAHHLAAVNVHAGVAEHLAGSDPARAAESLAQVRASSSAALDQMRSMVGLLRTGADGEPALDPTPHFADLPALVATMQGGQNPVRWRREGPDPALSDAVGLHVYRIVQEALTNAVKHGRDGIDLRTQTAQESLKVQVRNRIRGEAPAPRGGGGETGHGLVGMRERAALIGAAFDAGPDGTGSFVVDLVVPR